MIASGTHIQFTRRIAVFISHSFQDTSFSNARCLCLPVGGFKIEVRQRQDAGPGLAKMYRVPPDWAWWPAVDAPLDRRVRHRRTLAGL